MENTIAIIGKIDLSTLNKPCVTKANSFDFDWAEFDAIIDAQIEEASTIGTYSDDDDFQTEYESECYWDSLHESN